MTDRVSRTWKSWTTAKSEEAVTDAVCRCCGSKVYTSRSTRVEMVIAVLCSVLLLAVAITTVCIIEQWTERQSHRFFDRMIIWRDPIELDLRLPKAPDRRCVKIRQRYSKLSDVADSDRKACYSAVPCNHRVSPLMVYGRADPEAKSYYPERVS